MPTGMCTNICLWVAKRATYTMSRPSGSARLQVSWLVRFSECRNGLPPSTSGLVWAYCMPSCSDCGDSENFLLSGFLRR
ncbi:hypothetical protein FR5810_03358 [Bordetella pertussis]|nr:Uncharacterised protein [Bordetella pertussis]CFM18541.1 Uncharacterised protein [Bordetella pertussis]CFN22600.1 Uncharacterised protein [Bordetella pertussis]CFO03502.1 Uncharacterised protein [Bordetella pertussis]CFP10056.1 Uncharacterised protein [Bordetella pertussis]